MVLKAIQKLKNKYSSCDFKTILCIEFLEILSEAEMLVRRV